MAYKETGSLNTRNITHSQFQQGFIYLFYIFENLKVKHWPIISVSQILNTPLSYMIFYNVLPYHEYVYQKVTTKLFCYTRVLYPLHVVYKSVAFKCIQFISSHINE